MLNKKKTLGVAAGIAALVLGANVYALTPGAYLGGQLGLGDTHVDVVGGDLGKSSSDTGLAGRLFAGYQFDNIFGAELGYTKFSTAHGTVIDSDATPGDKMLGKTRVQTDAVDLVGKATLPLVDCFSVYGKLGVAYLMNDVHATVTSSSVSGSASDSKNRLLPTFGAGVAYDLTSNIATDLSWNRIQRIDSKKDINSTDLVSVGLIYSFG